jgi:hypothetical protein
MISQDRGNLISRKKPSYPVSQHLADYLGRYRRNRVGGIRYADLTRHNNAVPLYDEDGEDTLWSTVLYADSEQREIHDLLRETYAILKADGDLSVVQNLYIDRIDLCLYGNTLPYRVRIVNAINENFDYFYVKRIDANRVYGLELEHILSPSRIQYFVTNDTLIEEHIIGIPAKTCRPAGSISSGSLKSSSSSTNAALFDCSATCTPAISSSTFAATSRRSTT